MSLPLVKTLPLILLAKRAASRALLLTLSCSMVLQPIVASAQTSSASDDAILLLLRSLRSNTTQEARALIAEARASLEREEIPAANLRRINSLLEQAIQRIETRQANRPAQPDSVTQPPNASAPVGPSGDTASSPTLPSGSRPLTGALAGGLPITFGEPSKELTDLLRENPDLRSSMREIGRGRLNRDAGSMPRRVLERTGRTLERIDLDEMRFLEDASQPGSFVAMLRNSGLLSTDHSTANRALTERYDTLPINNIADEIIHDAWPFSALAAMGRAGLSLIPRNRLGTLAMIAGDTAESYASFYVNASLILRLSDLYGVELSEAEQETVIAAILAVSKLGLHYASHSGAAQEFFSRLGSRLASLRNLTPSGRANFFQSLRTNRLVTGALGNNVRAADGVARPTVVPPATPQITTPDPLRTNPPPPENRADQVVARTPLTLPAVAARFALPTAWAALETYLVGQAAKMVFEAAGASKRRLANAAFANYLMNTNGEGFIKFLILSMTNGETTPEVIDLNETSDSKALFIMNLARSARVCSPRDLARWTRISNGNVNASQVTDRERDILKFACDTNLNQARFARMATEFLTFNEIPQTFVTNLRLAGRENRFRMGEVLLQLQWLDGDRDPAEAQYFEEVVSKILGFETPQDKRYFERMDSFIRASGGMTGDAGSPTGFTVAGRGMNNPYDLGAGYTVGNGPRVPGVSDDGSTPLLGERARTGGQRGE